jgi:hypothetical protein
MEAFKIDPDWQANAKSKTSSKKQIPLKNILQKNVVTIYSNHFGLQYVMEHIGGSSLYSER